ncbi:hypothetical protein AVEN_18109-1 [Araneus ventricosus]|uniref:Uncharacterized protein n=1 Tax=Araneus ventricosus TaxID=182803 RepID=A0A4Y2TUL8_ARAVE|nr:hypothetical protein AVEN_18109-1 [Araneus ventricosus]
MDPLKKSKGRTSQMPKSMIPTKHQKIQNDTRHYTKKALQHNTSDVENCTSTQTTLTLMSMMLKDRVYGVVVEDVDSDVAKSKCRKRCCKRCRHKC